MPDPIANQVNCVCLFVRKNVEISVLIGKRIGWYCWWFIFLCDKNWMDRFDLNVMKAKDIWSIGSTSWRFYCSLQPTLIWSDKLLVVVGRSLRPPSSMMMTKTGKNWIKFEFGMCVLIWKEKRTKNSTEEAICHIHCSLVAATTQTNSQLNL